MSTIATDPDRQQAPARRPPLVGNGLVLAGTVLYLCEFAGILPSGVAHLPEYPGTASSQILADYRGHAGGLGFLVGWYAFVELGRVVTVVGVREALRRSGRHSALMDVSVAAATVGVVLEVASQALAAGAGALTGRPEAVLALDRGAWYLESAILAPTAIAFLLAAVSMARSGLFSRWLVGLGVVATAAVFVSGLLTAPGDADLQDTLSTFVIVVWVWLLWSGVVIWRARPRTRRQLAQSQG